ncbi:hypothetical protein WISP_113056 [Willisornis vidua]|uniref:G-protein coupled receptors family 2 profile 1 domain-containing protein n=1 Tax=Willisornis vidua TaxID=1566151 RepID=A0ABQ9CV23_9PASS|nr:hypothetical protein WISP_113056 [Willisornis vidua]
MSLETRMLQFLGSVELPAQSVPLLSQFWDRTISGWYRETSQKCMLSTDHYATEGKFCNRTFDDYACWPDGLPGTYVNVSCPWYLPWANAEAVIIDFHNLNHVIYGNIADPVLCYTSSKIESVEKDFVWDQIDSPVIVVPTKSKG